MVLVRRNLVTGEWRPRAELVHFFHCCGRTKPVKAVKAVKVAMRCAIPAQEGTRFASRRRRCRQPMAAPMACDGRCSWGPRSVTLEPRSRCTRSGRSGFPPKGPPICRPSSAAFLSWGTSWGTQFHLSHFGTRGRVRLIAAPDRAPLPRVGKKADLARVFRIP